MVASITRIHAEKTRVRLDRHPLIQRTLQRIERRAEIKPRNAELFEEADFGAAQSTKPTTPKRQPRKPAIPQPPAPGLRNLSATPRLVRRRRLIPRRVNNDP